MACIVVFIGFFLGSLGEINFSWIGWSCGIAASFFVASYGISVKRCLSIVDNNEWVLLMYNSIMASVLLFALAVVTGEFSFFYGPEVALLREVNFWFVMIVSGFAGFAINMAVFWQIKFTSALTNTISGTAKACAQTVLAWFIFGNQISFLVCG